jgi:hypothetical protein
MVKMLMGCGYVKNVNGQDVDGSGYDGNVSDQDVDGVWLCWKGEWPRCGWVLL